MVGARGFEPPTPWSRTSFSRLLNFVEFRDLQLVDYEHVAGGPLISVVSCGFWKL